MKPIVLNVKMTKARALSVTGSLGKPSKMPGFAYGLSADLCVTGSKLSLIEGTSCFDCYAKKANYRYPSVQKAHAKRVSGLYHPSWSESMIYLIGNTNTEHFRFHDSGDIQSLQHLINIVKVCEGLPLVKFWMPTQERAMIAKYLEAFGAFPDNLIIRVSGVKIDGEGGNFPHTSTVVTKEATCRAYENKNKCGECRACWDKTVKNVSYLKH